MFQGVSDLDIMYPIMVLLGSVRGKLLFTVKQLFCITYHYNFVCGQHLTL